MSNCLILKKSQRLFTIDLGNVIYEVKSVLKLLNCCMCGFAAISRAGFSFLQKKKVAQICMVCAVMSWYGPGMYKSLERNHKSS